MLSEESELNQTVDFDAPKRKKSKKFNAEEFIYAYRIPLTLLLLGAILIGAGIIFAKSSFFEEPKIEVLESSSEIAPAEKELVVELAGSVEKPGVYKLPEGARVEDLLIASGGFSADADREWIAKMINRAAKLVDGQKLYIAKVGEQSDVLTAKNEGDIKVYQQGQGTGAGATININTAGQKQLEELPGIGPVYAQSIIEHRPYSSVEELVSKGALKSGVYEKVKELIIVF